MALIQNHTVALSPTLDPDPKPHIVALSPTRDPDPKTYTVALVLDQCPDPKIWAPSWPGSGDGLTLTDNFLVAIGLRTEDTVPTASNTGEEYPVPNI